MTSDHELIKSVPLSTYLLLYQQNKNFRMGENVAENGLIVNLIVIFKFKNMPLD